MDEKKSAIEPAIRKAAERMVALRDLMENWAKNWHKGVITNTSSTPTITLVNPSSVEVVVDKKLYCPECGNVMLKIGVAFPQEGVRGWLFICLSCKVLKLVEKDGRTMSITDIGMVSDEVVSALLASEIKGDDGDGE